jgi:hypothetical protein
MQLIYSHRDKQLKKEMKEIFLICQKKRKNPDKHTNKILFEKREKKREREREREIELLPKFHGRKVEAINIYSKNKNNKI